ncbi:rhamnose-binding lectin-like [Chaetodon trifascialis]|uniref:rhamnose-binding lectin-like n=1 Tax=Chaetodon trifascialis TaxID=109706 RepID=UPI0039926FF8
MLSTRLSLLAFLAAALFWTSAAGQRYDVACPGVNSNLQCAGKAIEVLSVDYGDISDADCTARNKPAKVTESSCLDSEVLPWVKSICDGRVHCRLSKPNANMFTCDYSEDSTFVQITYRCDDKIPGDKSLKIVRAGYGRFDSHTCSNAPSLMTYCSSDTADGQVKEMCDSKQECTVEASEDVLGTPEQCDDLPKYLVVDYVCQ